MPHRHHGGVEDEENGSASTSEVAVPPDIDAFGQWLFDGPPTSIAEELAEWTHLQDQKKQEAMEAPMRFEEEYIQFQSLRRKQSELVVQCRSLRGTLIICAQELDKRKRGGNHVPYKSLLREKLVEAKDDSLPPTPEFTAIVGLLKEAANIRHSGSNSSTSREVEDPEDTSIRMAIHKKISELFTNEAQITRSSVVMLRLLVIYKQSCLDYRGIMLPLMRNFIHAKLEALVAEAATEALLSDLSLDTKKSTSKGNSHPKLSKKSSKAKKKIKDHREVKDPQDTFSESSDKLTVVEEEKAEQLDFPVPAATADELKLQEMLDYQRQFEEEAKQSALAKEATNEAATAKDTSSKSSDKLTVAEEEKADQQPDFPDTADELKLQERLDYQRQFEEEAKQSALAKEATNEAAPAKINSFAFANASESAKLGGLRHNHLTEVKLGGYCRSKSQNLFLMQFVEYAAVLERLR
ncbi:hypothetical protein Vadar_002055 [Vaccinium darrowii]|uniref:Uncharacterized protein n=1 Tax=Vaccinium darrowii TaxID=229202 RepID=A0ACB7XWY6_9ERIC|nr:hypothetical protein Vadar_002055 [Vaccinium darrowii]